MDYDVSLVICFIATGFYLCLLGVSPLLVTISTGLAIAIMAVKGKTTL